MTNLVAESSERSEADGVHEEIDLPGSQRIFVNEVFEGRGEHVWTVEHSIPG